MFVITGCHFSSLALPFFTLFCFVLFCFGGLLENPETAVLTTKCVLWHCHLGDFLEPNYHKF